MINATSARNPHPRRPPSFSDVKALPRRYPTSSPIRTALITVHLPCLVNPEGRARDLRTRIVFVVPTEPPFAELLEGDPQVSLSFCFSHPVHFLTRYLVRVNEQHAHRIVGMLELLDPLTEWLVVRFGKIDVFPVL